MKQPNTASRTYVLRIRLSEAEHIALEEATTVTGLKMADWTRMLIREGIIEKLILAGSKTRP